MGSFTNYLPNFVREYLRERRRSAVVGKAIDLNSEGKFEEAAKIYEDFATEKLSETTLMSSLYRRYAFEMWMSAKKPQQALGQAKEALRLLCEDEGKWLKNDDGENADEIISMVSQLYAAGFTAEGADLAAESNEQFEIHGLPVRCAAEPVRRSKFPVSCSQCGGVLPESPFDISINCTFCQTVVYAL